MDKKQKTWSIFDEKSSELQIMNEVRRAKIVLNTTDVVYGLCGTSNGCHVWISYVDAIST